MDIIQAPAGGAISPVNRQFYEGGQFMPDTGLFCGIKKKARRFARVDQNWASITVRRAFGNRVGFFCVARYASSKYEKYLNSKPFDSHEEAVEFAEEVIRLRSETYSKSGFQPHPTQLITAE